MPKVSYHPRPVKSPRRPARPGPSAVYRVRNWSTYNTALKQRGDLTIWFSEAAVAGWTYQGPRQRGGQFHYSALAIETALTLRLVYHLGLRQTEGFVQSVLGLMGLDLSAPNYTTLSRRQSELAVALPVHPPSQPLHLVVDSTGLKVYGEGEWKVRQHGWSKRRTWRKLHLGADETTGEIMAQTLTPNYRDDASQIPPLLKQIESPIGRLSGDGGYDKTKVFDALDDRPPNPPIEPLIALRKNAKIEQHGNRAQPPLPRDEILRAMRRQGRKRWKQTSGYHRRSLAETQVYRYKQIIGPYLRARCWPNQQTESRLGCAILNRMIHLGKPETYKVDSTT